MKCPECGEEIKSYCEDKDQMFMDMLTDNSIPFMFLVLLGGIAILWVIVQVGGWLFG